jgi:hypothetical protein
VTRFAYLAILLALLLAPRIRADGAPWTYAPEVPETSDDGAVRVNPLAGAYRLAYFHVSPFDLDAEGTADPLRDVGEHCLRLARARQYS